MHIAIVDLGIGNLRSVLHAVRAVAPQLSVEITDDASTIDAAEKIILPGQGAVGSWFRELDSIGLKPGIQTALAEKPLLGICVGMQALFRYCEEDGGQDGLNLFAGEVRHFRHFHPDLSDQRISIPQMGWNRVKQTQPHPLWQGVADEAHFYFLHSYCANLDDGADQAVIFGRSDYHHDYIAAIGCDNVFATQFHPEKSHRDGLTLIQNFCRWNGRV